MRERSAKAVLAQRLRLERIESRKVWGEYVEVSAQVRWRACGETTQLCADVQRRIPRKEIA